MRYNLFPRGANGSEVVTIDLSLVQGANDFYGTILLGDTIDTITNGSDSLWEASVEVIQQLYKRYPKATFQCFVPPS